MERSPAGGRLSLWLALAREAGRGHTLLLAALALLSSLVEVAGLGLAVGVLLGSGASSAPPLPAPALDLRQLLGLLVGLMAVRGLLQVGIAVLREWLNSALTDRLRSDLLSRVLHASSLRLERVGRGELLGLLMDDIDTSVYALDEGLRVLQNLIALLIYGGGVLVAGRGQAGPLLLGLLAAALAGLLQRSGAWSLGTLHTRLNAALQSIVGDGLHGLKAVRAAAAEPWLLARFAAAARDYRRNARRTLRRQAVFAALRDWLVVLVVALWLGVGGTALEPAAVATVLLLAYRAAGALGGVISSRRSCLWALPGYEALRQLRGRLGAPVLAAAAPRPLPAGAVLLEATWRGRGQPGVTLRRGALVAVVGPSGTGKSTLLDRVAGLLAEESSSWQLQAAGQSEPLELAGSQGAAAWRTLVAYAPQGAVLFEGSLADNLLLGRLPDRREREALLGPWLEQLGLEPVLQRPEGLHEPLNLAVDCFSGGEIHRLGLLRAWLLDHRVELLDEPTAFLDAQAAARVRQLVLERSQERLVLVATHDPELVAQAAVVIQPARFERQGGAVQ
ncbi:ATP-binding cassette domain-containing protein [Cyanobium sp. ATX 6A2]|uniref:ATP-binding cassette domain-containing protein n=1 Tax=Cyanobium sp. ATX 6A2 TaxID=2823700 RepID=UPI0021BCAC12|nr:ATP-binding cassette domain-containing protein [Cyanobium sp. ATX 6A2]MCP9888680.1 ATP-binding cassette domain-containing protein [Cyanobium sp. ATX 6A2]